MTSLLDEIDKMTSTQIPMTSQSEVTSPDAPPITSQGSIQLEPIQKPKKKKRKKRKIPENQENFENQNSKLQNLEHSQIKEPPTQNQSQFENEINNNQVVNQETSFNGTNPPKMTEIEENKNHHFQGQINSDEPAGIEENFQVEENVDQPVENG